MLLQRRPKSILFAPVESEAVLWLAVVPNLVIALESVVSAVGNGMAFDLTDVEARIAAADPGSPGVKRKAPRKRATRVADIEALRKALIGHIKAARDHAIAIRDLTGEAMLLPCPTKEFLGKLAGNMERYTVSRCFSDPAGHDLKTLWEIATTSTKSSRTGVEPHAQLHLG